MFLKDINDINYLLAFMNTKVMQKFLDIYCTGLHYSSGSVGIVPYLMDNSVREEIEDLSSECVDQAKIDWDSFETSWDFQRHPLV